MKQLGSFDSTIKNFRQILESLPDQRTGKNTRYGIEDAALSAFSVFFTQTPSFLAYQRTIALIVQAELKKRERQHIFME